MTLTDKIVRLREIDGVICAGSRTIAEDFSKRHDHVLRDIDEVRKSLPPDLGTAWFREDRYYGRDQKPVRCFDLTRDGWVQVVRRYTTPEANGWFLAYQLKFNEMEGKLGVGARTDALFDRSKRDNVVAFEGPPKPQSEFNLAPAPDAPPEYVPVPSEHADYWTDKCNGLMVRVSRTHDLGGTLTGFYCIGKNRVRPVETYVVNGKASEVWVRVTQDVPWEVVERNFKRCMSGPYLPIALATLRMSLHHDAI